LEFDERDRVLIKATVNGILEKNDHSLYDRDNVVPSTRLGEGGQEASCGN
jgi:hypothetical protein